MNQKIESVSNVATLIASLLAILGVIATIFYNFAVVNKDVTFLLSENNTKDQKIDSISKAKDAKIDLLLDKTQSLEREIVDIKARQKFAEQLTNRLDEIQKEILRANLETRDLLMKASFKK